VAKKLTHTEADVDFRHALYHFIVTRGHVHKSANSPRRCRVPKRPVRSALQRRRTRIHAWADSSC
jgi:hypothetical protein